MNKWKVDIEKKAESNRQMDKVIREILMKQNKTYQVEMDMKMATLQKNTYTKEEIVVVVNMLQSKKDQSKLGENNQTNPNLKIDTTYAIVSPLKKPRQTEEDSGLMQTE